MKSTTFGLGTPNLPLLPRLSRASPRQLRLLLAAVTNYKEHRMSGGETDVPGRTFPQDGTAEWKEDTDIGDAVLMERFNEKARTYYWRVVYTEGPDDEAWMGERDRNYVRRIAKAKLAGKSLSAQERIDLATSLGQDILKSLEKKKEKTERKHLAVKKWQEQHAQKEREHIEAERLRLEQERHAQEAQELEKLQLQVEFEKTKANQNPNGPRLFSPQTTQQTNNARPQNLLLSKPEHRKIAAAAIKNAIPTLFNANNNVTLQITQQQKVICIQGSGYDVAVLLEQLGETLVDVLPQKIETYDVNQNTLSITTKAIPIADDLKNLLFVECGLDPSIQDNNANTGITQFN